MPLNALRVLRVRLELRRRDNAEQTPWEVARWANRRWALR